MDYLFENPGDERFQEFCTTLIAKEYQGNINDNIFSKIWNKSLESFLIGHIIYHSKDVIEFINKGITKLSEYSKSIQVIITDKFFEVPKSAFPYHLLDP